MGSVWKTHKFEDGVAAKQSEPLKVKYQSGPTVGQVWRWLGRGESSDEEYTFVGVGRNWEQDKFFVFNRLCDAEIFIITKDDFFAVRGRWEHVER